MSEYIIQEETLTGIADGIRRKTGNKNNIQVSEMANLINSIQASQNTASISYSGKAASFVKLQTTDGTELLSFLGGENEKIGTFDLTNYIGFFLEIYYDFWQDSYIIKDSNNNRINTFNYYTYETGKGGQKKDLFFIEPKNYTLELNY